MSISYVQNGDTGLVARTLINQAIDGVNNGTLPYTGSAKITGSLIVTGSTTSTLGFTGSLEGTSSYAATASYVATAQTASYVLNAVSASYATTASYALNGGGSTSTGSLLMTASVSSNVITFTKGNGATFPITVDTGSVTPTFPYTGSAIISGSLTVTGSVTLKNIDYINPGYNGLMYTNIDSGDSIVSNMDTFTYDSASLALVGQSTGTMNLSRLGTAGVRPSGLVLPTTTPTNPIEGSVYFDSGKQKLWIYDGSQWLQTNLMP